MAAEENNNLVWNNLLTRMRQQMYYAQDYAHNVLQPPNMFIATSQKCISVYTEDAVLTDAVGWNRISCGLYGPKSLLYILIFGIYDL